MGDSVIRKTRLSGSIDRQQTCPDKRIITVFLMSTCVVIAENAFPHKIFHCKLLFYIWKEFLTIFARLHFLLVSRDPIEEIFEESESHEVRTVTSESRSSNPFVPTFLIRRESLWKLKTRRKSQRSLRVTGINPRLVCVECADKRLHVPSGKLTTPTNGGHESLVRDKGGTKTLPEVSS